MVELSCEYTLGDMDGDGDADLDDHALFAECLSGPGVTTPPDGCSVDEFTRADIDADSDVDLVDAGAFFNALVGE